MKVNCLRPAGLFLTMVLLGASPALLALDQITGLPFSETVVCESGDGYSEPIYIEGTYRIQMHEVANDNHTTSFFNVYWTAEGVGLESDAEYLLRGKWMEVVQENPPYIFLWNDKFRLIGKGSAENFDTYFRVQIVVNANGDTIIEYIDAYACEQI